MVIILQSALIFFLGFKIFQQIFNKKISIAYIDKNSINVKGTQSLKYFYEPKPNSIQEVRKDWLSSVPKYTINNDTLNERINYQIEKPKNVFRIITLGDSFTFGENVNTKDNYPELLEDRLNTQCLNTAFEVINLGVYGYDIQYEVERYKIRGQKYHPDLILWMLVDDRRINELMREFYNNCTKNNPNPTLEKQTSHYCFRTALDELERKKGIKTIYQILRQEFNRIFDFYNKNIVVINLNNSHQEILKNISKPKQVDIFSYDFTDKKYRLLDGHPNQAGHQKIAEDVFNYLTKNKLIPCN
ncbi:MAG: SGNH/GDSL hydrolase family protein [Patescibacteria group bacterium]